MDIQFTARRFKARDDVKLHAFDAVKKLDKYFDGIVGAEIILSYERGLNSLKAAEVNLHVHGGVLSAKEKTDDYFKSIDAAVEKLNIRLGKYKSKLRAKDKGKVRRLKDKV